MPSEFSKVEIAKVDDELGLVFAWAIICKEDGEPYFDLQGDHIPEDAMLRATCKFMKDSRISGEMHLRDADGQPVPDGAVVFSFPVTDQTAEAMGIVSKRTGWMVAFAPGPAVLDKCRSGEYLGVSIAGTRVVDENV